MTGPCLCVDDPEIDEVINLDTGIISPARKVIGSDYDRLEKLRMELAEANASGESLYACPICMVGVYLSCRRKDEKRFFFKHRTENGNCPAITRGELSKDEMLARKYNAAKESRAHIRLKEIIADSLRCDPGFSEVETEKVWRGMDRTKWRKPDVQALWKGKIRIAFEIQLSTTFLHVIAERRNFYRQEGGLLCWIFKSFDQAEARMTQDDIFHNNNRNLFIAGEETLKASAADKALMLDCHWLEPQAVNGEVIDAWCEERVSFSHLQLDAAGQRVFFRDCDGLKAGLAHQAGEEALKQRFFIWWRNSKRSWQDAEWNEARQEFKKRGVFLPEYTYDVLGLLNGLYSAREGECIGWKHPNFISAANTVANSYKNVIRAFRAALLVYDRGDLLKREDKKGNWAKRVIEYKKKLAEGDKDYDRDEQYDPLIAFLFPEVWAVLSGDK